MASPSSNLSKESFVQRLLSKRISANYLNFAWFSSSTLALRVVAVGSSLVLLRFVPPDKMGIWQTLVAMQVFADIAGLGITNGLNRELPFALGRNDTTAANELASTALAYAILSGTLQLAVFVAIAVFSLPDRLWFTACIGMGVLRFGATVSTYVQATMRGNKAFGTLSNIQFLEAILQLATLYLVFALGFNGMVLRYAVVTAFVAILLFVNRPMPVWPAVDFDRFRTLFATGVPLFINAFVVGLSYSVDRLVLHRCVGVEAVGLYAPAATVLTLTATIAGTVHTYMYPRLTQRFAVSEDRLAVWQDCRRTLIACLTIGGVVATLGYFLTPIVFPIAFPKYVSAIRAIQLACLAGFLQCFDAVRIGMYVTKAWGHSYVAISMLCVLKWISVSWCVSIASDPLSGAAVGNIVSGATMAIASIWLTKRSLTMVGPNNG